MDNIKKFNLGEMPQQRFRYLSMYNKAIFAKKKKKQKKKGGGNHDYNN